MNTPQRKSWRWTLAGLSTAMASLLAGCGSTPPKTPQPPAAQNPAGAKADEPPKPSAPTNAKPAAPKISNATSLRDYRQDAARHLYEHNASRIYQGKLQPQLYAIGVLEVNLDRQGQVTGMHWMRAPRHAPEVITEIERTVRAAAPFPLPSRLGRVIYTDTWLWDASGKFQLDTLTEGQL